MALGYRRPHRPRRGTVAAPLRKSPRAPRPSPRRPSSSHRTRRCPPWRERAPSPSPTPDRGPHLGGRRIACRGCCTNPGYGRKHPPRGCPPSRAGSPSARSRGTERGRRGSSPRRSRWRSCTASGRRGKRACFSPCLGRRSRCRTTRGRRTARAAPGCR